MSGLIQITFDASSAQAELAKTQGAVVAGRMIHSYIAAAVHVLVRNHLLSRNTRSGTSNYWAKAAEATSYEADDATARVIIRHPGIAWHRWGGTIKAKPGKAIAIPLRTEVKGIWPSEKFPNRGDAFVYRRRGKAFLAAREGTALRIFYLLVKSVTKPAPDPSVLPTDAQISTAAQNAIRALLRRARAA